MSTNSKTKKKSTEGGEELKRVDMTIDVLTRELNSSAQNEANTEWLSLLPWSISSHLEETLLWYGIGIAARVHARGSISR